MTTYDFLDTRNPIQITLGSDFFDDIAESWNDAKTVVRLMKREAADQARYAWAVATTAAQQGPRPSFEPIATQATQTQPVPRITDAMAETHTASMPRLLQAWEDEGEQPTVNLVDRRPRHDRVKRRRLLNFWNSLALMIAMIWS
jgi:hypothetical protein